MKLLTTAGCVTYLLVALHQAILLHENIQPLFEQLGGADSPQVKVLFAVIVASIALPIGYLSRRDSRVLASMITVMLMAAVLTNAGSITWPTQGENPFTSGGLVGEGNRLEQTPNIFFIIADGYGSFKHLADNNIDQSKFAKFLVRHGFTLYDDVFSNYQPTTSSLAAMLNGEHHYYSISRKFGEVSQTTRTSIAGRNAVVSYLKDNGYAAHYIHGSSYLLTQGCFVDSCFPVSDFAGARRVLTEAVPGLAWDAKTTRWNDQKKSAVLAQLDKRLASLHADPDPLFLYLHFFQPSHPPNRVQGNCEESRELAFYANRVGKTEKILEAAIDRITLSDPNAVVLLAGDHGPMLSNRCNRNVDISTAEEYRDRAGALLAIRWPRGYVPSQETHPVTTINAFRFLLASMVEDRGKALQSAVPENVYVQGNGRFLSILEDGVMQLPPVPLTGKDKVTDRKTGHPRSDAQD